MQRFDPPEFFGGLLAPATILGTPAEAGLNQKNSTSLTLGIQTAFDFYPPEIVGGQAPRFSRRLNPKMLNGTRKNLSNLSLSFVIYLRDTTLEAISKMQIMFKDKRHTLIITIRCVIPPTRGRGPTKKRSIHGGVCDHLEEVSNTVIGR